MELLLILIRCEIIIVLVLPIVFGLLKRRGVMITEKQLTFSLATLVSLIIGSAYLSFGNPETLFAVPFEDWLTAIALSLLCWVFGYPFSRWLSVVSRIVSPLARSLTLGERDGKETLERLMQWMGYGKIEEKYPIELL